MSFEKDKYEVVKKAVPKEVASFCYAYFLNKRNVAKNQPSTVNVQDQLSKAAKEYARKESSFEANSAHQFEKPLIEISLHLLAVEILPQL